MTNAEKIRTILERNAKAVELKPSLGQSCSEVWALRPTSTTTLPGKPLLRWWAPCSKSATSASMMAPRKSTPEKALAIDVEQRGRSFDRSALRWSHPPGEQYRLRDKSVTLGC